jgi:hypothetical protein
MNNKLKQGIVIVTSESTRDFLRDCLLSCHQDKYPIMVVSNNYLPDPTITNLHLSYFIKNDWNGYELAGIEKGMEEFDEFILLHDTVIIKDQSMFDIAFNFEGSIYFTQDLAYSYFAKYRTSVLKQMVIPRVYNLEEAIREERPFGLHYSELETSSMQLEPLGAGDHSFPVVERHGRKGIILENSFLSKHKSHY